MNIQSKDFIFSTFGVSGREDKVKKTIENFAKKYVDDLIHDTTGSLICLKKGRGSNRKKVILSAHMDTIGFVITYIDERGFLRFSEVGYHPKPYLLTRRVLFEDGTIGVIGHEKDVLSVERQEDIKDMVKKERMFIDIGVKNSEEAKKRVKIGDMCAIYSPYVVTDNVITGGWMDDRVGCFLLLEVMENMSANIHDIYFVFSSQEEVGIRGATTSSYRIKADVGLAIDLTDSSDLPEGDILGSSVMGKGAAIKIIDSSVIVPKKLVDYMETLAKKSKIPYQRDVLKLGGTDAHAIQLSRGGALSGGISVPARYIHSPDEMCALSDIQASIDLALKFCEDDLPFLLD